MAAVCLAALALSFASLYVIERPFRQYARPMQVNRRLVVTAALAMLAAFAGGLLIVAKHGFPSRIDAVAARFLDAEHEKFLHPYECLSVGQTIVPPSAACRLGRADVEPHTLLWGDSHSLATALALEQVAQRAGSAVLYAAAADCPVGIGFSIDAASGPSFVSDAAYQYCQQYNQQMLQLALSTPGIHAVVLSSRWTNWRMGEPGTRSESPVDIRLRNASGVAPTMAANKAIFVQGFEALVKKLVGAGKTVWIVGPLPEPSVRVPRALFIEHVSFDKTGLDIPVYDFAKRHMAILDVLSDLSQRYPIKLLWPHRVLCNASTCPIVEDGHPMFLDDNHLSKYAAAKTSPMYEAVIAH